MKFDTQKWNEALEAFTAAEQKYGRNHPKTLAAFEETFKHLPSDMYREVLKINRNIVPVAATAKHYGVSEEEIERRLDKCEAEAMSAYYVIHKGDKNEP